MGADKKNDKTNKINNKKAERKRKREERYKSMKPWKRVLFKTLKALLVFLSVLVGILLLAALVLLIVCLFNPTFASHIASAWKAFTMSDDQLAAEREKAISKREEVVESAGFHSDALSHDLVPQYITVEQHNDILLGTLTLEKALAENGYVATPEQKQAYKSGLLTREQYVYIIIGEKNFEKTLAENGYVVDNELKTAMSKGQITAEQYVSVLKGEMSLDDALGMYVVTEELNNALVEGRITREQYTEIIEGRLSLEKALEENAESNEQPSKNDEPEKSNEETADDTPNGGEEPEVKPELPDNNPESTENKPGQDVTESDKPPSVAEKPTVVEDEASKALKSGKITTEQYTQIVLGEITLEEAISQNEEKTDDAPANTDISDVQRRKSELINKMYVLRNNYISQIDSLVVKMKSEYMTLPAEQRTTSAKQSIASGYLSQINAMEQQCDAQVKAVVDELRQLLKSNGEDTSLADTIWSTYVSEKENTKAYYINTYGD